MNTSVAARVLAAETTPVTGAYRVDATSGTTHDRVQSQWFTRPADERFLSLSDLYAFTKQSADNSRPELVRTNEIRVVANPQDADRMRLALPCGSEAAPTHWSFGQLASLVGAPAGYLRDLPAFLAALNLQHGLSTYRPEMVRTYTRTDGTAELRAVTGADYGRIHDHDVVSAVRRIAGNGTGDTRWKVPGVLEGLTKYNPYVDISKQTTTLFASDRDVFIFLVDDTHPIEIGTLPNGEPDLVFRGFYVWNSEVGAKSAGVATFYLRGVCQNRMMWGVEGFKEITLRHTKHAPGRFLQQAMPTLRNFADSDTRALTRGVQEAKSAIVARDEEERREFLTGRAGLTKTAAARVIEAVTQEEGAPPQSVWDMVQGMTAVARRSEHQDTRVALERAAGKLLDKVTGTRRR